YPTILSEVKSKEGTAVHHFPKGEEITLMSSSESDALKQFMRSVVTEGTASALKTKAYQVCGKTGSAQVKEGGKLKTNAWFVGFAPMDDPKLAVCVLVEDGETGGRTAAPLARELFDLYLK
ncbi:penicillin-binding transpeptidase domain-containing protein, partial [Oribacterium parvum]